MTIRPFIALAACGLGFSPGQASAQGSADAQFVVTVTAPRPAQIPAAPPVTGEPGAAVEQAEITPATNAAVPDASELLIRHEEHLDAALEMALKELDLYLRRD